MPSVATSEARRQGARSSVAGAPRLSHELKVPRSANVCIVFIVSVPNSLIRPRKLCTGRSSAVRLLGAFARAAGERCAGCTTDERCCAGPPAGRGRRTAPVPACCACAIPRSSPACTAAHARAPDSGAGGRSAAPSDPPSSDCGKGARSGQVLVRARRRAPRAPDWNARCTPGCRSCRRRRSASSKRAPAQHGEERPRVGRSRPDRTACRGRAAASRPQIVHEHRTGSRPLPPSIHRSEEPSRKVSKATPMPSVRQSLRPGGLSEYTYSTRFTAILSIALPCAPPVLPCEPR